MDLLAVMLIGAVMFGFGWLGGFRAGTSYGQERERLERRIDEITETVRVSPAHLDTNLRREQGVRRQP